MPDLGDRIDRIDRIDRDFSPADVTIDPAAFAAYRETLRVVNRMLDLLERVIEEDGVK